MGAHDRFAGAGQPLKFKINENVDTPLDRPFFSWRGGSRPGMSILWCLWWGPSSSKNSPLYCI